MSEVSANQTRPTWFTRLDTSPCKDHLQTVEAFADERGLHGQLMRSLARVCQSGRPDDKLGPWWSRWNRLHVRLYKDPAPRSFYFTVAAVKKGQTEPLYQRSGYLFFLRRDQHGWIERALGIARDGWVVRFH